MGKRMGNGGKATSVPGGLACGVLTSLAVTVIASGLLAWLVLMQKLRQDQIGYGVMVLLIIASWAGAKISYGKIQRQRFAVSLGSGGAYFVALLMITALFFGGQYSAVGETALLILCGAVLAVLLKLKGKAAGKTRKGRRGYR